MQPPSMHHTDALPVGQQRALPVPHSWADTHQTGKGVKAALFRSCHSNAWLCV